LNSQFKNLKMLKIKVSTSNSLKNKLKLNTKIMSQIYYKNHPDFTGDYNEISNIINYTPSEINSIENDNTKVS